MPDQLVQPELITGQPGLGRRLELLAGRPDCLVRLLGVLDLARVRAGGVGQIVRPVQLAHLGSGRPDRGVRQRDRIRTHIGDVPRLVQILGDRHRPLRGVAQLPAGLLLQGRGAERRVRPAGIGLGLDAVDGVARGPQLLRQRLGLRLVESDQLLAGLADHLAAGVEVASLRHTPLTDVAEPGREERRFGLLTGVEGGVDVPVGRAPERDPVPLPVDDQAGGDGLHPTGRQPWHDLLPQHRRDLVAVQPIEDPAGLLGVDQVLVEITRIGHRLGDRVRSDLVEDHPPGRHLGLQLLQQVPGDRLTLAVTVGGEQELVGLGEGVAERAQCRALVRVHHVQRLEAVVHVHTGAGPLLTLVLRRHLRRAGREVAHVTAAGLDDVAVAEKARDLGRLGRRLDDHESPATCLRCHGCPLYLCCSSSS